MEGWSGAHRSSSAPRQPPDGPGGASGQAVTLGACIATDHTGGAIRAPRLGRGVAASWASPTGAPGRISRPWRQQGARRRAAEGPLWPSWLWPWPGLP